MKKCFKPPFCDEIVVFKLDCDDIAWSDDDITQHVAGDGS